MNYNKCPLNSKPHHAPELQSDKQLNNAMTCTRQEVPLQCEVYKWLSKLETYCVALYLST